jgi:phosphoribosylanthranilate isomerase
MKVKVCGITNYEDAVLSLDAGVDALGFNFFPPSPRYIRPEDARAIIRRIPPLVVSVGLFVNVADPGAVSEAARAAGVHILQLHGDETPEYCSRLADWPLIKALRLGKAGLPEDFERYPVQMFLLDSKDDLAFGGTGKTFDWNLVKDLRSPRPIMLAGGLRPDNVGAAIRVVAPCAVDVCSGVESAPGKKDAALLRQFMNEVRNADSLHYRS